MLGSDGKSSVRSEDAEYNYPFDTDSLDDPEEGESEEVKEDSSVQKSVSYGSLAYANFAGALFYSNASNSEDEDWIYYSHRKSDVGCLNVEDLASVLEHSLRQSSKRNILPWKRRKLSFISPNPKGEPLLKKDYGEEGGDDIDFDRRQLSSSDEFSFGAADYLKIKGKTQEEICKTFNIRNHFTLEEEEEACRENAWDF